MFLSMTESWWDMVTQRYGPDGTHAQGISAETSPPPCAPQPTLPSMFHGRYSDDTESAILQSISLGRRTGDIQDIRTLPFYITPVVFPAYSPLSYGT